jgi:hypothetical protein
MFRAGEIFSEVLAGRAGPADPGGEPSPRHPIAEQENRMFLTGVVVGSVLGAAVCAAAAVVHFLADEAGDRVVLQPALVPLHVAAAPLVSMN